MINSEQVLRIATSSIGNSKLRSALTTLGIMIGVAAVVTNVSIGSSFNQYFTDEISSVGSNFIIAYSKQPNLFFENELELIKNTPGIIGVSPLKSTSGELNYLFETRSVDITGVEEELERIQDIKMDEGSFIRNKETYVAVLGYDVANKEFDRKISHRNSINITFRQNDGTVIEKTFKVNGIIQKSKPSVLSNSGDLDSRIFIPISTLNEMTGEKDYGQFFAMANSPESVSEVSDKVDERLARNFGVQKKDMKDEAAKPYGVVDQAEVLNEVGQIGDSLTAVLFAIAMISLIVGSIGIINIMLITVTERTREIGIMKSLGYTYYDILSLFLLESVIVSLLGGVLGTIIGGLGAYILESFLKLPPVFPFRLIVVGVLTSIIVGVVAGIYPAKKAAKMNPVDALRYQ